MPWLWQTTIPMSICSPSSNDQRPFDALRQAKAWARGEISVGDARRASAAAHAAATAHMADHCSGAAAYALRAAELGGINTEQERRWQDRQLPVSIRDLAITARALRRV
jgi:hypothetical protein